MTPIVTPSAVTGHRNEPRDHSFPEMSARGSFCASATQSGSPLAHTVPTSPMPGLRASSRESAMKRSAAGAPVVHATCMRMRPEASSTWK